MKRLQYILLIITAVGTMSCASIVSRSRYPVTFTTNPPGAGITIENRDGLKVYGGNTPATVMLNSSAGYMRREHYKITFYFPGQEPKVSYLSAQLNGWYFGNILIGRLLGMLIVDPATGAMYRIPDIYRHENVPNPEEGDWQEIEFKQELRILDVNNLPEGIDHDDLVLISR